MTAIDELAPASGPVSFRPTGRTAALATEAAALGTYRVIFVPAFERDSQEESGRLVVRVDEIDHEAAERCTTTQRPDRTICAIGPMKYGADAGAAVDLHERWVRHDQGIP